MTKEQMAREMNYRIALSFLRDWVHTGLIDQREYVQIDTILTDNFSPVWGHLCSETR